MTDRITLGVRLWALCYLWEMGFEHGSYILLFAVMLSLCLWLVLEVVYV